MDMPNTREQRGPVITIMHEPASGYGEKAGGAAKVAEERVRHIPNSLLYAPTIGGLELPHVNFPKPPGLSNDELYEHILGNPTLMELTEAVLRAAPSCEAHYFVAGGIIAELKRQGKAPEFGVMGHSWDRVVGLMDRGRTATETRSRAELEALLRSAFIVTSTHAEKEQLAEMYGQPLQQHAVEAGDQNAQDAQGIDYGGKIFDKTFVIPLGVEHRVFDPSYLRTIRPMTRQKLLPPEHADPNNLVIYTLGRMSAQKGHLEAIRAYIALMKQTTGLKASLSIVGGPLDNGYFEQIKAFRNSLGAADRQIFEKGIHFHGAQPAHEATAMGDIFLGPSTWETFFLSLGEAMAAGKPTAVTDMPILREVGGDGTLYFNRSNPDSIAGALYNLITNPREREENARQNIVLAQDYRWETVAAKVKSLMQT